MNDSTITPDANISASAEMPDAPRQIALADLCLSPLNPRQSTSDEDVADLANSLRTVGLIQNLSGYQRPDSAMIEIVAGGRRLHALKMIADQDGLDQTGISVSVKLAATEAEARAWATTENIAREALHPADEIVAYRNMAESGATTIEIAKAFAVTERHVKGRLRLADLADPILEALRGDEITLDMAAAYTVNADPAAQCAVFEHVGTGWQSNPNTIRNMLTNDAASANNRLAKFVGRERYESEGGTVREDLFGDEVYFTDADVLQRIADEMLEGIRTDHIAAGWKWVEIAHDRPEWEVTSRMGRTYPKQVELTDEHETRYDELSEKIDCDAASDAEHDEFEQISKALEREDFSTEQMAHAGAFIWIDYDGTSQAYYGLIRAEDTKDAIAAGVLAENRHAGSPSAAKKPKGPYSAALVDDLRRVRTGAAQAALLEQPDLVLDLLTFALSAPVYSGALPLGLTTEDAQNAPAQDAGLSLPKQLQASQYDTPMDGNDAAEAFTAFRRKKPATKARMLTENVARMFGIGLAGETANPFAELIVDLAGIDVRRVWTPTADFLGRLKASQLEEIMEHIAGEPVSTAFAKMKKTEKVQRLHAIFKAETGIPPLSDAQRARADAWTPQGIEMTPETDESADTSAIAA